MASDTEHWYDIPGYTGRYQVSSRGNVRGLDRIDDGGLHRLARQRRTQVLSNGRTYVNLAKRGGAKTFCVSALLARIYGIPNPEGWSYVIHRNHDNRDFRRGNLAWSSLAGQRMHDGHKFSCHYYGVTRTQSRRARTLCWVAVLRVNKRRRELGYFATPEEAAYAYDVEVRRRRLARPLNGLRKPVAYNPTVPSLPGEIWRAFPGWRGQYEISNKARVRTAAHRTRTGRRVFPRLRRIAISPSGAPWITLKLRRFSVARAVQKAFPTKPRP